MSEVSDKRYLLVKRGLYWRPDGQGYTGIKDYAGRYFESDADPEGGVTAIHEDDAPEYTDACYSDLMAKHASQKVSTLSAEVEALVTALRRARRIIDDIDDYMKRPGRGDWGEECACCMGELLDDDRATLITIDATLAKYPDPMIAAAREE